MLGSAARAGDVTDFGLPVVAADSQPSLERAPETQPHPNDERWLNKPFSVGLSTILGAPQAADPFLMVGAEVAYALPYVSLGGTLGYLGGINVSVAARGRLHLGHAIALTLGARAAWLPLDDFCGFTIDTECDQKRHWSYALFGGGEFGIEGRTQAGFMWRAQGGLWGLLAHGGGTCQVSTPALNCSAGEPQPGVVATQEVTLGWAF